MSWTNQIKNFLRNYLLWTDGAGDEGYLLYTDGAGDEGKILLGNESFANLPKNPSIFTPLPKNSSIFTNQIKH